MNQIKKQCTLVYMIVALVTFLIEVYIALNVNDAFIRPHGGDFLVVIMLYALFRGLFKRRTSWTAVSVFVLACAIETIQATSLPSMLTHLNDQWLPVVVGSRFDVIDIVMYGAGTLTSYSIDFWMRYRVFKRDNTPHRTKQ